MTREDAFKLGFAEQLAVSGVAPSDLEGAMCKRAVVKIPWSSLQLPVDAVVAALPFLLAAPGLVGFGTGYTAGRAQQYGEEDVDHLKEVQSLENYQDAIAELKRIKATAAAGKQKPVGADLHAKL